MSNEYINKEEAKSVTWKQPSYTDPLNVLTEIRERIDSIKPADVAPVRHARWVNGCCDRCGEHALYWSISSTYHESDFCPFCGAKMDAQKEE